MSYHHGYHAFYILVISIRIRLTFAHGPPSVRGALTETVALTDL